jgi:hypothetical protein
MTTSEYPATAAALKSQIERLRTEILRLEALAVDRQAEFRAAFDRGEAGQVMAELLRMTADLMAARESAVRLEDELTDLRRRRFFRPWWWRMLGG